MSAYLWVALGGAMGACARFVLSAWVNQHWQTSLPLGTLFVNVVGSFLFGVLYVVIFSLTDLREPLRLLILVGGMGALTTFSTFSFETVRLMEEGLWAMAAANVVLSCLLCLLGLWLGMQLAKLVF